MDPRQIDYRDEETVRLDVHPDLGMCYVELSRSEVAAILRGFAEQGDDVQRMREILRTQCG